MRIGVSQGISAGIVVGLCTVALTGAQEPPAGRGGGPGQGQGRGGGAAPAPAVAQVARSPVVDQAAHDRGRALWASHCIDCHGSQARGSDTGPNIIRTKIVNFDRSAVQAGSVLGPFLKAGHPTQSQKPSASFTDEEVVGAGQLPRASASTTRCADRRSSRSATSSSATPRPARRTSTAKAAARRATPPRSGTWRASRRGFPSRSICSSACSSRWRRPGTRPWRAGPRLPVEVTRCAAQAQAAADRNAVTVTIAPASGAADVRRARRGERLLRHAA